MPDPRESDNLLPAPDEFDAAQFALHGLLCRYLATGPADARRRADAIIASWRTCRSDEAGIRHSLPLRSFWSSRARRWTVGGTGLAAAACLLFIFVYQRMSAAHADAINAIGFDVRVHSFPLRENVTVLEAELRARQLALEEWCSRISTNTAVLVDEPNPAPDRINKDKFMDLWAGVYRRLRNLGRYDDAVNSAQAALTFARRADLASSHLDLWSGITLNDIGAIQTAAGQFAPAADAYDESIRLRDQAIEQGVRLIEAHGKPKWADAERAHLRAATLVPPYWQLSYLALAQNDRPKARKLHQKAESALRDFFAAIPHGERSPNAATGSAYEAYQNAPPEFITPPDFYQTEALNSYQLTFDGFAPDAAIVQKLRAHLIRTARLFRLEGRLDEARLALAQAVQVPHSPCHDEDRTDFTLYVELARIALLQHDLDEALRSVSEAETNVGAKPCSLQPGNNKDAITGLPLLELDLLKSAALLAYANSEEPRVSASRPYASPAGQREGVTAPRAQARQSAIELLTRTLATIDQIAAALPGKRREEFLNEFAEWQALLTEAREPAIERSTP